MAFMGAMGAPFRAAHKAAQKVVKPMPGIRSLPGASEPGLGPSPAGIGNAVGNAVGGRMGMRTPSGAPAMPTQPAGPPMEAAQPGPKFGAQPNMGAAGQMGGMQMGQPSMMRPQDGMDQLTGPQMPPQDMSMQNLMQQMNGGAQNFYKPHQEMGGLGPQQDMMRNLMMRNMRRPMGSDQMY